MYITNTWEMPRELLCTLQQTLADAIEHLDINTMQLIRVPITGNHQMQHFATLKQNHSTHVQFVAVTIFSILMIYQDMGLVIYVTVQS